MKFATWNIACGAAGYHGKPLPEIAAWINAHALDICVLQEVDRFAERSGFVDVPAFLEEHTGLHSYFFPSFTRSPQRPDLPNLEYGNCLLSRWPLNDVTFIPLFPLDLPADAHRWEREDRSAIIAKLTLEQQELWVATTHLAYSPELASSSIRQQQVTRLAEALATHIPPAAPFILGADFNTSPTGEDTALLREHFTLETANIGPTWPLGGALAQGKPPYITIDHILTRHLTLIDVQRYDEPTLSDHSVVMATFTL